MSKRKYDVFISHASEDKAAFVEPLAIALRKWGLKVWFDKFSLRVGDSLRDSIEMGLANSRYGVVVFSPSFLAKNWPKAELNGLFARQMQGKNRVILPIWHGITADEMIKSMPIQADAVALKSSDGVESVARSLVEVVRPSLLKLEVKKGLAFEATDSFIDIARAQHPGYDFAVHSGGADAPIRPGTVATVQNNTHRIDIKISNPALIPGPFKLKLAFEGAGVQKAVELYRTGRPQSWKAGEFKYLSGNIPFLPPSLEEGALMTAGPSPASGPARYVRLEIGSSDPVVLPIMEMRHVRGGAEEGEVTFGYKSTPLTISLVASLGPPRGIEVNFSTKLLGFGFSQCEKAIKAIDGLLRGDQFYIIDIETGKTVLDGPCRFEQFTEKAFSPDLRALISLGSQIENYFSVTLQYPESMTDEDSESLNILDCLLNGRPYRSGRIAKATIAKAEGQAATTQRILVSGEPVWVFEEPTNYLGFFMLFGKQVPAPPWGLYTEMCASRGSSLNLQAYDHAKTGDEFLVELKAQTPTRIRWKQSLEPVENS